MVDGAVDTERYPLSQPGSAGWARLVARVRRELQATGCCVLADFVRPEHLPELRHEGAAVAPHAYDEVEVVNVYNIDPDTPLPDDHPGRIRFARGNAFVARDRIPDGFLIHRLYLDPDFQRFVAACMEVPAVHPLADPLAGLCVNVLPPGRGHPWHFDTNEFAVSLLTQPAEAGGVFEFCPGIRSPEDENLAGVRAVLEGEAGEATDAADGTVRRLALRPGDLQLFRGRFSLHRVTTVEGTTPRHTAILSYSERPGVVGSVERTRQLFGRVLPEHLAAAGHAVRGDRLLD
jgi:hypothetical protein